MRKVLNPFCILVVFVFVFAAGIADCFALGETSREDIAISTGVTESTVYVTVDGGYNVRTHILRITSDADVTYKASYSGYYGVGRYTLSRKSMAALWDNNDWTYESVRKQAADYENTPDTNGIVIAATNGDFFNVKSGEPIGSLVMEGSIIKRDKKMPFFAVLKNGSIVIRKAGGKLSDVTEAVGGRDILLWNGKLTSADDNLRNPRAAIGVCSDGTVVIVNVDGREPASAGVTLPELSAIMKAQGCKSALNLDGGGSASFMTRRADEKDLQFRSNHSDGPERRVSSALLVIQKRANFDKKTASKTNAVKMSSSSTQLKKDSKGVYRYKINDKKKTGFYAINGKSYLFSRGKGVTGTVKIGSTYYEYTDGLLSGCTDVNSGNVIVGYCGGSKDGTNLIYAYHDGNNILNIGINPRINTTDGSMKNWVWKTVQDIPWYSVRAEIKKVYLANGVTNIGAYSLYSTKGTLTGGAEAPECNLSNIRIPSSIKKIGAYSLYNKPHLADVKIPAGTTKIEKGAFMYSGTGSLCFKGASPPAFGGSALKKTGFSIIKVKNSKDWKSFVTQRKFKKYGYKKLIGYY